MKHGSTKCRREVLIGLTLATLCVAAYLPVHNFEFLNYDDPAYVTANPNVFRGLTAANIAWAFKSFHASNWHPVTWLSHMLDCQIFGPKPAFHHLMNLFFHTANTLLLFGLFRQSTGAVFRSAMVAGLFALHPLHVESVAWISERKDVLSTFFGLLAIMAYAKYVRPAEHRRPGNISKSKVAYPLALFFFALSLMSKPMLVTLPFVLLLLDFWPLHRVAGANGNPASRASLLALVREKIPFLFLSAASSVATMLAQKEAILDKTALPVVSRVINAALSYTGYLRKTIYPNDLAPFYPYRHQPPATEVAFTFLILLLISFLCLWRIRRAPYLLVGWLWYLGTLVPAIGLVQVGAQSMADRYTYIPLVGIFLMCVWGASDLLSHFRLPKFAARLASATVLTACFCLTQAQLKYWRDSETLFRRDVQVYPENNATGHHCLGRALFLKGDDLGAIPHYEEVLRLLPDYPDGHLSFANSLNRLERFPDAVFHYQEAIRLDPKNAEAYKSFGTCLAAQMKLDAAKTNFLIALQLKPDYAQAHARLGTLLMAQGETEEALHHLATAVKIHPDFDEGRYYLANALLDQKRFEEAAIHFRAAIEANPGYAAAMNDWAWMTATQIDPRRANLADAIKLAQRACELSYSTNAQYLETLGAAFSEAGRFSEAIIATEKAASVAAAQGQQELAAQLQRRVANYRSGRTYSGREALTRGKP